MSADPLADVVRDALGPHWDWETPPVDEPSEAVTAAVRLAIAGSLQAEEESVARLNLPDDYKRGAQDSINNLRAYLLGRPQRFDYGPGVKA